MPLLPGIPRRSAAALAALLLLGAGPAAAAPRVVASIAPVADLVRRVGGPAVEVATLLPAGASPHTFEPTPAAVREIAACRAAFLVGAGLDAWAAKVVAAAAPTGAKVVDLSQGVDLITELEPGTPVGAGPRAPGDAANPHYWLDPRIALGLVDRIEAALAETLPGERAALAARAAALRRSLEELDAEFATTLAALPSRRIVTFHNSWPYLARRYGLEIVGVVELSPGREPPPRHLAGIVARIRALAVPVVFAEPQLPPRAAEVIAAETGARVVVLDPIGGVPGREGYLELMRYNLRRLGEGLGGT